jgi:NAD dependent epimerase/dehydratase family enzyme
MASGLATVASDSAGCASPTSWERSSSFAERTTSKGAVNVSSPRPTDNRTFKRTLRRVLGRPHRPATYRWMSEVGSAVISTETELVLKSRVVVPERLVQAGYSFIHPELEPALRSILEPEAAAAHDAEIRP